MQKIKENSPRMDTIVLFSKIFADILYLSLIEVMLGRTLKLLFQTLIFCSHSF